MKRIISAISRMPKRSLALASIVAAVIVPAALMAYGPGRAEYTVANPADKVVFNSIKDNPNIGHEFNFVGAREATAAEVAGQIPAKGTSTNVWNANSIEVKPGKSYVVRMYVHNNGRDASMVARNVLASFNLPTTTGKSITIQGNLSADNATPKAVWDEVVMTSSQSFNLKYVSGSLLYENNKGNFTFGTGNQVFSTPGVKLGYTSMNGEIPGCFQYAGYLTFIVTPQFATPDDFTVSKQVRKSGATTWSENVTAKSGETVEFLLKYANTGSKQHDNVTYFDKLPAGLEYVQGSATYSFIRNGKQEIHTATNNVTTTGVNVGSYAAGASSWLKFSAKVKDASALACGTNNLRNIVSVKPETGSYTAKEDDASVTVTKECADKDIKVCRLSDNTIITIKETEFDATKHSKNLDDCKSNPKDIVVCRLSDKKIVTITEAEYANAKDKYSKTLSDCDSATVTELPETGAGDIIVSMLGLGSLTAVIGAYLASRRAHLGA